MNVQTIARQITRRMIALVLLTAMIFSACQKKADTQLQTVNEETQLQQKANELAVSEMNNAALQAKELGFTPGIDGGAAARQQQQTILQIAAGNPHFSALAAAVVKTGLAGALGDAAANLTVFAPVNSAFAKLPVPFNNAANINAITNTDQIDFLRNVLLYHVIGAEIFAGQIPNGRSNAGTLKPWGDQMDNIVYFSKNFGLIKINGTSAVICPNQNASNGVIHVINNVLLFPTQTIAQIALANPNFSSLVAALAKTNLVSVFTGSGDFTVFAPVNSAFAKLPAPFNNAANISAISNQAQIDALANILLYHVTDSRYFGWDLGIFNRVTMLSAAPANKVTTVIGWPVGWVKGNKNRGFSYINPGDILATNGVVHVIGDVLQP